MFGEPVWLTAEPRCQKGERHAIAQGEQWTACGLPIADYIVRAEIPWRDGRGGTKGKACDECDDVAS